MLTVYAAPVLITVQYAGSMGGTSGSEDSSFPEDSKADSSMELSPREDSPAELTSMASSQAVRQRDARVITARSNANNLFMGFVPFFYKWKDGKLTCC